MSFTRLAVALLAMATLLGLANWLPAPAFAAPPERPLADDHYYSSYGGDEHSAFDTGEVEVYSSSGVIVSGADVTQDSCSAHGLTTSNRTTSYHAYMRVRGNVSAPFTCYYTVQIHRACVNCDNHYHWTITINNVNETPTNISLSTADVNENMPSGTLVGTLTSSDPDTGEGYSQSFTYSLVSGDTDSFYTSGNRLYTNASFNYEVDHSYNVTVRTTDQGGLWYNEAFAITVNDVNEAPTDISLSANHVTENLSANTVVGSLSSTDPDVGNTFSYSLVGGLAGNSSFSIVAGVLQTAVSFNYEAQSSYTIRVRSTDQGGLTYDKDFTILIDNVNEAPMISNANPAPLTLLEDASALLTVNATDPESDTVFYTVVSAPDFGTATFVGNTVTYTPTANYNGLDTFLVRASDGSLWNNLTINVTVTAVNDAPSFTKGTDRTVLEDAGAQTVSDWATSVSKGPSNESGQTLSFVVSGNTNPALFASGPAVDALGSLTFTPAPNANGWAMITVYLHDNGGTAYGGVDSSSTQSFFINVTAVNDAPSFTKGSGPTVLEDAGAQTVSGWATSILRGGGSDESGQTLNFVVSGNTNSALFSSGPAIDSTTGNLTYMPAANANGSATITIYLHDNGGTENSGADNSPTQSFVITVTAVNDEPSFTKGADETVNEDVGLVSVSNWAYPISHGGGSYEDGQTLTFSASNDNNGLFLFSQQPAVASDGTLTYRPANNAHGSATVSVYLRDSGDTSNGGDNTSPTQTFLITVSPVNDAPVLNTSGSPSVTTISEDDTANTGMLISALIASGAGGNPITDVDDNAAEGIGEGLAVTAVDNNSGVWQFSTNGGSTWTPFGAPSASAARLLASDVNTTRIRFVPSANWHGTVNPALTFRAWDQKPGSGANGETADIGSLGTGGITPFSADSEFASLTVSPVNDAPILDNTGNMALDPILEDQTPNDGTSVPAIIASAGGNRITEVLYEVAPVEGIAVIGVDNAHGAWQFTTGSAWTNFDAPTESAARLLESTTSTKVRFVPEANWSMGWNGALTPTLSFRAWDQTSGGSNGSIANVTTNGGITAFSALTGTAVITVTALNDVPTFVNGDGQTLDEGAPAQVLLNWATAISPGPADEGAQGLQFNIVYNTAPELFSVVPTLSPTGTLTYTPAPDAYGEATIIFELQDSGGTVGGGVDTSPYAFFTISINGVNDAPSFTKGADQTWDEDSGTHTIANWATAISRGPANEDWQDLDFILGVSNQALFAAGPVISSSGQLSYTLALNANGVATITVQLHDGGGTQFGGINVSDVQTFTLTVNPINDPPVNTAAPQVSGLPFVNDTLTATPGDWNDNTDRTPGAIVYTYQWQRADDADGTNMANIAGATAVSYIVTLADAGKYLRVRVTATDDGEGTPASQNTAAFSLYIRVGVVNADVTLSDFARSTVEDTPLGFSVADFTANYTHTGSAPLERIRITGLPLSGTLAVAGVPVVFGQEITATLLGQLVYTPTANWNGPDVFHWNATNDVVDAGYPLPGIGVAVTITTQAVNDAPVLTLPGGFSVNEDAVSAAKVFAVADPDAPFVIPAFTDYEFSLQASHGVITLTTTADLTLVEGGNGSSAMTYTGTLTAINAALNGVRYQSEAGYSGLDVLEIAVADHGSAGAGEPQTDAQFVEVFVVEVNGPPVNSLPTDFMLERDTTSAPLAFSIADDTRAGIKFTLSAGNGAITLTTTSNLTLLAGGNGTTLMTYRGTLARVNAALATARYRPPAGYHGPVNLMLQTDDLGNTGVGGAQTDTDVMTITVNATPLAADDVLTTSVNVSLTVPAPGVLGNDTDADGDGLTAILLADPTSGTLTLSPDGAFIFTPTLNFKGTATFTYRASDAITTSLPATVTIQINRANPNLVVAAEPATALLGQAVTFTTTVSGFPGGATPTGAVTFYADGDAIADATLASGIGVQTATTLGLGDHVITVTYQGDLNYNLASTLAGASVSITHTLAAGGIVNGGVVSGTILNNGTLISTTIYTGSMVIGGVICGTTANYGTLVNVTFCPNAIISGGVLSGTLTGTSGQPALLLDLTVAAGSTLAHVIIGPGVVLGPDVTIGDGVRIWLSVGVTGTGLGDVASLPEGISCGTSPSGGSACEAHFPYSSVVTLTAAAATGSTFAEWAGACTGQGPCELPFNVGAAQSVTATFTLSQYALDIVPAGNGSGSVTRTPDQASYIHGTVVTLTARPDSSSSFSGWSGDIVEAADTISVTVDSDKTITATFTLNQYALDIVLAGNGSGSVTRTPDQASYTYGTVVTLTAQPDSSSNFTGWSGDIVEAAAMTSVTVDSDKTITATFTHKVYQIFFPMLLHTAPMVPDLVVQNPRVTSNADEWRRVLLSLRTQVVDAPVEADEYGRVRPTSVPEIR